MYLEYKWVKGLYLVIISWAFRKKGWQEAGYGSKPQLWERQETLRDTRVNPGPERRQPVSLSYNISSCLQGLCIFTKHQRNKCGPTGHISEKQSRGWQERGWNWQFRSWKPRAHISKEEETLELIMEYQGMTSIICSNLIFTCIFRCCGCEVEEALTSFWGLVWKGQKP